MKCIQTNNAPTPAGHYSQAVVHNGTVYVAGQLPIDPADRSAPLGSVTAQTERVFANAQAILEAASSGLDRALQVTIYVSDIALWDEVNRAYTGIFGDHKPARAVVPVKDLHYGAALEVQIIAAVA